MANPVIVACPADTWTKVATAVQVGNVWTKDVPKGGLLQTYRITTNPAPTDLTDAMPIAQPGIPINSSFSIDVYIFAKNGAGSVRVDV